MARRARFLLALSMLSGVASAGSLREVASIADLEAAIGDFAERTGPLTVLAEPSALGVVTAVTAVHPDWDVEIRWTQPGTTGEAVDGTPGCALLVAQESEGWMLRTGAGCAAAARPVWTTAQVSDQFGLMAGRSSVILAADDAAAGLADGLRSETDSSAWWRIRRVAPTSDWDPIVREAMDRYDATCGGWLALADDGWWSLTLCNSEPDAVAFELDDDELTVDLVRPSSVVPRPAPAPVPAPAVVAATVPAPSSLSPDLVAPMVTSAAALGAAASPEPPPTEIAVAPKPIADLAAPARKGRRWTGERTAITFYGATYGGYIGGATAYLIGEATETTEDGYRGQTIWAGALIGVAVGGVSAALLGGARPYDEKGVMLLYGSTALGALYGHQLGRLFVPPSADGAEERTMAANLGGSLIGMGLSMAFAHKARPLDDQAHFLAATALGTLVGTGIGDAAGWDPWDDRTERAAVEGASALAFSGAAMAWNLSDRPLPSWYALTWYETAGAFVGGFTASAAYGDPGGAEITGGVRIGLGAGYVTALVVDAIAGPSPRSVGLQSAGLTAGSLLGAGIPLAAGADDARITAASVVGGAVVGDAVGAALAPAWGRMRPGNWVTAASLGTWTAYQVVGWSYFGGHLGDSGSAAGFGLAAAGAGSMAMLVVSPFVELSVPEAVLSVSGGAWGTWFGAWGGSIGHLDPASHWALTLGTSNVGLVATAIGAGLSKGISWRQVAWIDGLTLGGAAAGGLVGAVFLYDEASWDPLVGSVLTGSALGLAAGVIAAILSPGDPPVGLASLPPVRLPGGKSRLRFALTPEPLFAKDGSPGFLLRLEATEIQ